MNPKTTVILLLVFLFAIAGAFYLTQEAPPAEPSKASRDTAINNTSSDTVILNSEALGPAVKQFIINFYDGIVDAKQYDGQWLITRPHQFHCHTPMIDEMLGVLGNMQGTIIDQTDLHKLIDQTHDGVGKLLGQPERVITLNPGIDPIHIRLHQRLGAGRGGITIIIDKRVTYYNADDSLHDFFETIDQYSFYPRSIKPLLMPETRRVEIMTEDTTSVLTQHDGLWQIGVGQDAERALEVQLDQYPGVSNYFALLKAIEMEDFHPYDRDAGLQQFGLHKPLITARFVPMDGKPNNRAVGDVLSIGVPVDPNDQYRFASYARATDPYPLVFTIPTRVALAFGQQATAFRDPRIIATPSTLIASIKLKFADGSSQAIELPADNGPLLRDRNGDRRELSIDRVALSLKQLSDARAIDYMPTQLAERDELVYVHIMPRLGGDAEVLTVYDDPESDVDNPTVLVNRGEEPFALRVPRDAVAGLLDPESLLASSAR